MRGFTIGGLLALSLGLAACDDLPGKPDPSERYQRPDEIADFSTLYATRCSACHGAEGTHGAARPLGDPLYLALVPLERVRDVVARGIPGTSMPGFSHEVGGWLTDAQIDILAKGLFTAWSRPDAIPPGPLPPYDEAASLRAGHAPGDAIRGAAAYAEFCARCHGADGSGGPDGGSVVDHNFLALVSGQMLRNSVTAGRPDLGMPGWNALSDRGPMPPQAISDVVAWLGAARPQPALPTPPTPPEASAPPAASL